MDRHGLLTLMAGAALMGLTACTSDETAQVEQLLQEGKIVFSVKQAPVGTTRSVAPQQAPASVASVASLSASVGSVASLSAVPLRCSGLSRDYWLLPEVSPMTPGVTTRGKQLTAADVMTAFGVSAYKTPSSMADLDNRKPDYFYNLKATRVGESADYTVSQDYYWPSNDERLWFYAYYPYNSGGGKATDNLNVVLSSAEAAGPQTIDYTVASAAADQVDLMTAHTGQTSGFLTQSAPRVDLTFEHQLCGIRFKVGSQFPTKGYIQSIQLKNVYTHGVYTIGSSWSHADGDLGDFTVSYDNDTKMTDTPGQMITDDDAVFLMIPTTFTYEDGTADEDKAKIIVQFWDGDARHTVEASLEGTTWTAGETVTYSLSSEKLTTLKIDHIDYAETVTGAPYTDWQNGDVVGLYVVANGQGGGTDLRYTNVKCTYTKANDAAAGTWTIAPVVVGEDYKPVIMYPGDNYYFYYPYSASGPAGTPSAGNEGDASADKFWSSVIAAHTVQTDQSAPASFKQSDLQVAKAVVPTAGNGLAASTISASMARQVGLAVVVLGTDQANKSVTFTNGVAGTPTKADVKATSVFATNGNTPYLNGSKYYFYTKAGVETSISSSATEKDAWAASLNFTLAAGANEEQTAHSDRKNWEYVNAVWQFTTVQAHTWTIPANGTYTMECWGAAGGTGWYINASDYGRGAYTSGTINLTTSTNEGHLYVYVGGKGTNGVKTDVSSKHKFISGGFNGGGRGMVDDNPNDVAGGGGGATDIRLLSGATEWSSRIMVAAGGGGGHKIKEDADYTYDIADWTGGLHGGAPNVTGKLRAWSDHGATANIWTPVVNQTTGNALGQGVNAPDATTYLNHGMAGGGGGYYGGVGFIYTAETMAGRSSGGSSFISGATSAGCSTVTGYAFDNATAVFKKGTDSTCPSKTIGGSPKALGQEDGYARITLTRW